MRIHSAFLPVLLAAFASTGCSAAATDTAPLSDETGVELSSEESVDSSESALGTTGDGRTSNLEIPLVATLYQNSGRQGLKFHAVVDMADLRVNAFNDAISSFMIQRGPGYDSYVARTGREPTITFFEHNTYGGAALTYRAGDMGDVPGGWHDRISSIQFNSGLTPLPRRGDAGPYPYSIPAVVVVYTDRDRGGLSRHYITSFGSLTAEAPRFEDSISSVEVLRGPAFDSWQGRVELCRDSYWRGGCIDLSPSLRYIADLRGAGFNDVASSMAFR